MAALSSREKDLQSMLAAQVHIGCNNADSQMKPYIWRRRNDGIHILNIGESYQKILLAARIICAIENPADVIAISARPYGQRAVLKFAQHTGAQTIAGRFTPGTFTNQITKQYREPRLMVVGDPRTDSQPVTEASYVNMPVIAFCDSDSPLKFVDVAIPSNNKGKHAIGLMFWMLAREVNKLRGTAHMDEFDQWTVPVDLFFYRDPEELEKAEEEQKAAAAEKEQPAGWEGAGAADAAAPAETTSDFTALGAPAAEGFPAAAPVAGFPAGATFPAGTTPGSFEPTQDWSAPAATGGQW